METHSILVAIDKLSNWITRTALSNSKEKRTKVRVELDITLLSWLKAQAAEQKLYFRDKSNEFEVSAVGFICLVRGSKLSVETKEYLSTLFVDPETKLYGAQRFSVPVNETIPDPMWNEFSGFVYVLPAIELYKSLGFTYLAVNLPRIEDSTKILDLLASLAHPQPRNYAPSYKMIPSAQSITDTVSYGDWSNQMSTILRSLNNEDYSKIVLARSKKFRFFPFGSGLESLNVLQALEEMNMKGARGNDGTYLFCLQLRKGLSFLGNSPERLFHVKDNQINTAAVAGTVRLGHEEQLWSEKNLREHNIVIDHILDSLRTLGAQTCKGETKAMHLPRILHLNTPIRGIMKSQEELKVFDILDCLHPTPAVCGMPRRKTLDVLKIVEHFDRGLFAGPFGWISKDKAEFCVAIRSAGVYNDEIVAYAGSGIVKGSTSEAEWEETELKMSAFTDLLAGNRRLPVSSRKNKERAEDCFNPERIEDEKSLNCLWGSTVIDELTRYGVNEFFVAPGSRSAPLTIGAIRSKNSNVHIIHDERSAGFMAIGYGRATRRAAAVITSSGTAVANLLPAVVEAFNDSIPLVILTADRPPELRDTGSNQTISQPGIFGCYTRYMSDVPCPSDTIPLRKLVSDIDHAVFMSGTRLPTDERYKEAGPVHLNFMFRESLAPKKEQWNRDCLKSLPEFWKFSTRPLTNFTGIGGGVFISEEVFNVLENSTRGMIIVGGASGSPISEEDRLNIDYISRILNWPIVADVTSGMRFNKKYRNVVQHADLLIDTGIGKVFENNQTVLQFGDRIVSKKLAQLVGRLSQKNRFSHILVTNRASRHDPWLSVTHKVSANINDFMETFLRRIRAHSSNYADECTININRQINRSLLEASSSVKNLIEAHVRNSLTTPIFEPWLAYHIISSIDYSSAIFLGNSMPIRDVDVFAAESKLHLPVVANRGASGIDGLISSSIGYALGQDLPVVSIIGDMSSLHDMNALHALRNEGIKSPPVTLIIINNAGGAIFSMLPISSHPRLFTPAFDTPHNVGFENLAKMFGLDYSRAECLKDITGELKVTPKNHKLIEVVVNCSHQENAVMHSRIREEVSSLFLEKS